MSDITVLALAEVLKVPVEKLIPQLSEAGIDVKSADDTISEESKVSLLTHLRKTHGR